MDISKLLDKSKKLSVLYVEDDISRDATEIFLSQLFNCVHVAIDGVDGLTKYKEYFEENKKHYDIVISDINMPNMNGIELTKEIFAINEKQILIIVSAHDDSNYLMELLNLGVYYYVLKPIKFDKMMSVLKKVCDELYNVRLVLEYNEKIKKLNKELVDSNVLLEDKVKERTQELESLLYFDKLTSLKSYHSLIEDLSKLVNSKVIFFLVNIDSFHSINNLYGFKKSNNILIQFANCLKTFNAQEKYTIYRVYADEFVLCKTIDEDKIFEYEEDFTKLVEAIKKFNFSISDSERVDISTTIGISIAQDDPFVSANMALRHAKKYRKSYMVYYSELDSLHSINNTFKWSHRLKKAISENLILAAFQPIVDKNKNILKYEVLMRLAEKVNNTYNIILPGEFLDSAIKTKHYNSMMAILIEKTFICMYNRSEQFSINLSYEDIYNHILIDTIIDNLKRFKKIGNRLIIEILETENIEDLEVMKHFVKEVRKYGVSIAIDDFGTGHSNFSNVMAIEPDYIKIDGSFIKNIHKDPKSLTLVKAIVTTAKELKIKTIAEFVHNEEVFDILVDLEVDEFQGFYISEPLLNI